MQEPVFEARIPARADLRWSAQLFQSIAWKEFKLSGRETTIELKAAGDPVAGFLTVEPAPIVAPHAYGPSGIIDLLARITVQSASVVYSTATYPITNTAAFIAEGASKPEIQPRWTNATARLEEVAVWCKVTRQALEDVAPLSRTIDVDLTAALDARTSDRVINGSGTTPDILGVLATPGIQTVAFSTNALNSLYAGIAAVATYGTANGIVMNPADLEGLAIAGGSYGIPAILPPIVTDSHLAAGTALVGDWRFAALYQRGPVTLEINYVNDDIVKNKLTVVAYHRVAFVISRPQAITKVAVA